MEEEEEEEALEEGQEESNEIEKEKEPKYRIDVQITFNDKNGEVAGKWFITGFSAPDERLYVTDVATSVGNKEEPPAHSFPLSEFPEGVQDRIYDYLDEIKVDDSLASFVRDYAEEQNSGTSIDFFKTMSKFMSL